MSEISIGKTAVHIGEDVGVVHALFDEIEQGAVCVLHEEEFSSEAEEVCAQLKRVYRIFRASEEDISGGEARVPEHIRHIVGVGTAPAAEACKRLARQMGIGWSLYFAAPSTDDVMCDYPPNNVFIDKNVLLNCPFRHLAAGYGILFSQRLASFERFFSKRVLAIDSGEEAEYEGADDAVQLALKLLEISSLKRGMDSAELMARLLKAIAAKSGRKARLIGEYKFLSSCLISTFYGAFLGAPSIDCMPPACLDDALDVLSYLGIKEDIPAKKVDFFDANAYFRISYILSEYRMDLLERLEGQKQRSCQRFWRRLYPDAGYWLKSEVTRADMLGAMSLAGAFSDSLLGYAFASGITARFRAG